MLIKLPALSVTVPDADLFQGVTVNQMMINLTALLFTGKGDLSFNVGKVRLCCHRSLNHGMDIHMQRSGFAE